MTVLLLFLKSTCEADLEIVCVGDNMTFQYTLNFSNKRDDKTRQNDVFNG